MVAFSTEGDHGYRALGDGTAVDLLISRDANDPASHPSTSSAKLARKAKIDLEVDLFYSSRFEWE